MNQLKKIGILLVGSVLPHVAQAVTLYGASHSAAEVRAIGRKTLASNTIQPENRALPIKTITTPLQPKTFKPLKYASAHGHGILQLGGFWSIQGRSQQININGLIGDYFNVTNSSSGNFLVGVGYLMDGPDIKRAKMSYGLDWFYLATTSVKGTVLQENTYTNLAYTYHVTHYPLYAVAKSTFQTRFPEKEIVLDVGVGPNFMSTSHFQETSLGADTLPDTIFAGTTTTTFSATAGVGFKWNHFYGPTQAELGYRFFYLGQGNFKPLTNQTLNNLTTGAAFANALIFTIIV